MTTVVVADDQPVVRHGLAAMIGAADGLEVVGSAADGEELVALVTELTPDAEQLVQAVRLVADGSMLLGPQVTRRLVADVAARRAARPTVPGIVELTARERDVVLAVARGLSNAEIAAELYLGEPTVKSHVSEALRKTGCRDRVQLVVAAYESGLVKPG